MHKIMQKSVSLTGVQSKMRALQSQRDKCKKGGHAWLALDKQIRTKRKRANRVAENGRLQGAAFVSHGVCRIILEMLHLKAMTARGGNRKRRLNDMLRMAGVGGFRGHIIRNAAKRGIRIIFVDAGDTSNECALCSFVSKESRISRDSVCVECGDESHADLNAACVILKRGTTCPADRAEGQPVQRRRADDRRNQPTRRPAWPRKRGPGPPQVRWGARKLRNLRRCLNCEYSP